MIDLTRRRLILAAPAIILTPGLLMKVKPNIWVPVPAGVYEATLTPLWQDAWKVGKIMRMYNSDHSEELVRVVAVTSTGVRVVRVSSKPPTEYGF